MSNQPPSPAPELTKDIALNNLYAASRRAPVDANQHDLCLRSAQLLAKELGLDGGDNAPRPVPVPK
jgi:hypothetical protein